MSIAYEKIMIDLGLILKSEDADKLSHTERLSVNYQRMSDMLKEKFELDKTDYRSGYLQGEASAYQMVGEEIQMTFHLNE